MCCIQQPNVRTAQIMTRGTGKIPNKHMRSPCTIIYDITIRFIILNMLFINFKYLGVFLSCFNYFHKMT